jgi:hypothetical protein
MRSASFTTTIIIALSLPFSHAFQASKRGVAPVVVTTRSTLFATRNNDDASPSLTSKNDLSQQLSSSITTTLTAAALFLSTNTLPAHAVSGGGLDYAGLDISNQNYSNGNYKGKDFTQVIAKAATFANSNLQVSFLLLGVLFVFFCLFTHNKIY